MMALHPLDATDTDDRIIHATVKMVCSNWCKERDMGIFLSGRGRNYLCNRSIIFLATKRLYNNIFINAYK